MCSVRQSLACTTEGVLDRGGATRAIASLATLGTHVPQVSLVPVLSQLACVIPHPLTISSHFFPVLAPSLTHSSPSPTLLLHLPISFTHPSPSPTLLPQHPSPHPRFSFTHPSPSPTLLPQHPSPHPPFSFTHPSPSPTLLPHLPFSFTHPSPSPTLLLHLPISSPPLLLYPPFFLTQMPCQAHLMGKVSSATQQ